MVAAAVVGGAVVGGVASSKAASKQASATQSASNTQAQAQREANDLQWKMYEQNRADQEPWRQAGITQLSQLSTGLKPGGEFNRNFQMSDFQADPGYAFRQSEGLKAIDNSAAARGSALSGATLKALTKYGQDYASNEYQNSYNRWNNDVSNRFNRISGVAGTGQQAVNQVGSYGQSTASSVAQGNMNTANNIASNTVQAGNARASGYVGMANAANGAVSNYMTLSMLANNGSTAASTGGGFTGANYALSGKLPNYGG